jgi:hypothetical protein
MTLSSAAGCCGNAKTFFQHTIGSLGDLLAAAFWLIYGTIRLPCSSLLTDTAATVVSGCSRTTDLLVPHKDCVLFAFNSEHCAAGTCCYTTLFPKVNAQCTQLY